MKIKSRKLAMLKTFKLKFHHTQITPDETFMMRFKMLWNLDYKEVRSLKTFIYKRVNMKVK
jgi:hypothetical protein